MSLHKDMVKACKELFPDFYETRHYTKLNNRTGMNSIPDLTAPDESFAIECETLGVEKRERFVKHSKRFKETLLVLPSLDKVKEIWMYDGKNFRKFKEAGSPG